MIHLAFQLKEKVFFRVEFALRLKYLKGTFQERSQLPIYQYRNVILKLIQDNQVVIIAGETGSGKSTQGFQYG